MRLTSPASISWSTWIPLRPGLVSDAVPAVPGLYRIRTNHDDIVDYIGQTGAGTMTLRRRVAMLAGLWGDQMPYRDPHTAGPAMWAWLRSGRDVPEVSTAAVARSTPLRRGLEALAISQHRWAHGCSPRWNFGRMPSGYRMSSANNRHLVAAGRRFRGGIVGEADASHLPGIPPLSRPDDDPSDLGWGGLDWTPWTFMHRGVPAGVSGLYRLRHDAGAELVYIGEGNLAARVVSHLAELNQPESRQAAPLGGGRLECSLVEGSWPRHQRLELENDLIANHVHMYSHPPGAQFLG